MNGKSSDKIFLVSHSLGVGGAEGVLVQTANHLVKQGYAVSLILFKREDNNFENRINGVPVLSLSSRSLVHSVILLRKIIKKEQPKVVYGFLGYINIILGFLSPKFDEIAFIGRENAVYSEYFNVKSKTFEIVYKLLGKIYLNKLSHIISQSNFMKNDLREVFNIKVPIAVLKNPLPDTFRGKHNYKSTLDVYKLLAVGRLDKVKNIEEMFRVISMLPSNYHLDLIGHGSQKDQLVELAKSMKISDRINFLGYIDNPMDYMVSADLLILTSHRESYPNVVLEATSSSLFTVSYVMPGGIKEVIENEVNGVLVEMYNVTELVEQIIKFKGKVARIPKIVNSKERYFALLDQVLSEYL